MMCRFAKQYSGPRDEHVAVDVRRSCVDGGRTIECDVAYLPYDVAVDAARARLAKPTN